MNRIEEIWQTRGFQAGLLLPVSVLYRVAIGVRSYVYKIGWRRVQTSSLPVVVVGNVSVGGTGKTPLCAFLVSEFQKAGWRPAIVSRGYGGERHERPRLVSPTDLPEHVGDEPLMLSQQTDVPVCLCVHRASAVEYLSSHTDADIVFADDGLQHLAMARDAEVVVVDGMRGFGNGWLLPAGPLREPASRLAKADMVAVQASNELHGSLSSFAVRARQPELFANTFDLTLTDAVALANARTDEVGDTRVYNGADQPDDRQRISLKAFAGQSVVAMAGIGHPERFFNALRQLGLKVNPVARPDHHSYTVEDLEGYGSQPVLVTSKDAVKIRALGALRAAVFEVPTLFKPSNALHRRIVLLEQAMRMSRQKTRSS